VQEEGPDDLNDPKSRHDYIASHTQNFLAAQVRALRGDRTQKAFAELVGITQQQVSQLERGHSYPSLRVMLRIAAALDHAVIAGWVDFATFRQMRDHLNTHSMPPTTDPPDQESGAETPC